MLILFTGQKGGAGKTTTSVALASEFVRRGYQVGIVDADPQGTATTFAEVAAELGFPAPEVVQLGQRLLKAENLVAFASRFDFAVIDTAAGRNRVFQSVALSVADLAILPCGQSYAEAWAISQSVEDVDEVLKTRPEMMARLLISRKSGRTKMLDATRKALKQLPIPQLAAEISYRVAYHEFLGSGRGLVEYAPKDAAAAEIIALADEVAKIKQGIMKKRLKSGVLANAKTSASKATRKPRSLRHG